MAASAWAAVRALACSTERRTRPKRSSSQEALRPYWKRFTGPVTELSKLSTFDLFSALAGDAGAGKGGAGAGVGGVVGEFIEASVGALGFQDALGAELFAHVAGGAAEMRQGRRRPR